VKTGESSATINLLNCSTHCGITSGRGLHRHLRYPVLTCVYQKSSLTLASRQERCLSTRRF